MDDYRDYDNPEEEPEAEETASGPILPGGISLKTAATAVLIVAVAVVLWMVFVGPRSSEPAGLPDPTATAEEGTVVTATLPAAQRAGSDATDVGAAGAVTGTVQAAPGVATLPATVAAAPTSVSGAASAPLGTAPTSLTTGGFVRVFGTGTDGIRFRYGPGLTFITIRIVSDGEVLRLVGGPDEGDGYRWYRLQDDKGNVGWAAQQFLEPIAAPGVWSPPAASPTFRTGSGQAPATSPPSGTAP